MVQIKCNNCRRIVEVQDNWDRNATCNVCGGFFTKFSEYNQQYKPENAFNQLGSQIRNNMPRIMLGSNGISTQNSQGQSRQPVYQNTPHFEPPRTNLSPFEKEERLYSRIRNIGFIVVVAAVIIYAVWRIFFG